MDPVYPTDSSLSPTLKQRREADCKKFEEKKKRLYSAVNRASDGNSIRICEFFRWDSHYYISNQKVTGASVPIEQMQAMPLEDRVLLCRTIAHSVMRLHDEHVVHSDIKDTNVLLKWTRSGKLVGKLIDFDCSFLESDPPQSEDELGGDQVFLAPECCLFMCGEPVTITCKSDVFSLGLLFHQYLAGHLPYFDPEEYDYAHEAVLDDKELFVSFRLPDELRSILAGMLEADPEKRISMRDVFTRLGDFCGYVPVVENTNTHTGERLNLGEYMNEQPTKRPGSHFYSAGEL